MAVPHRNERLLLGCEGHEFPLRGPLVAHRLDAIARDIMLAFTRPAASRRCVPLRVNGQLALAEPGSDMASLFRRLGLPALLEDG